MARTKFVAVLLGPTGVGLVGLFESTVGVLGTIAGMGIAQSAVRQVAKAAGTDDQELIGRTVRVLRRVCWFTGLLGALLTAALAWPLSVWAFGNRGQAWPIAILGTTLLLSSISGGQMALIQGIRRIGDIARIQILSVIVGTIISVGLYTWLRERGIVPVLIISSVINLGFSWWFARRVAVPAAGVSWRETFTEARGFITLGLAFMWSGLVAAGVALATRAMILRGFGMEATGLYQAAWGISGVFAGFILGAMGTDFYPRLTAVAHDNAQVNQMVNEQTEVGVLMALPGLLATLVFSPWIIHILYSAKFTESAHLLPWFVLGVFGRVVSWPMGYILLAKGEARWFAITETLSALLHLTLIWLGLRYFGIVGGAAAFAILYGCFTFGIFGVAARLSHFRWSKLVAHLLLASSFVVTATFLLMKFAPELPATVLGGFITLASGFFCIRQVCRRLGQHHRVSQIILRLPLIGQSLAC